MDARTAFDLRDSAVFLDVRERSEWDCGHIEGAVHIPLTELPVRAGEIQSGRDVVVVCRSGHRSELAARWLRARGVDAHNLDGGMVAWASSSLPFVSERAGPPVVA